jgi:superfamily I DNA and/or RNA helicase
LTNLVVATKIDPAHIGIIAPYKANVTIMERWIQKKPEYAALKGMAPPATVDSYQGQEADIMCVVLGTTKKTGPGFTRNANRLNVMLSRQKSVSSFCLCDLLSALLIDQRVLLLWEISSLRALV